MALSSSPMCLCYLIALPFSLRAVFGHWDQDCPQPPLPTHQSLALHRVTTAMLQQCPGKESSRRAFWQPVASPGEIPEQAGDAGAQRGELRGEQEQRGSTRAADSSGTGSWSMEGKTHFGIKISPVCTEEADLTHPLGKYQSCIC